MSQNSVRKMQENPTTLRVVYFNTLIMTRSLQNFHQLYFDPFLVKSPKHLGSYYSTNRYLVL